MLQNARAKIAKSMNKIFCLLIMTSILFPYRLVAQGSVSGSLEANTNFYFRDTAIGASGTPHYDNLLSGTDAWLSIIYNNRDWGLTVGGRFDLFNNSNLHDPTKAYTGVGIGRLYVEKEIGKLDITAGHFYEQFGSGITFRAYEARSLGIDNAVLGVLLKYQFNDHWFIKAFTGKQKNLFSTYNPVLKGAELQGFVQLNNKISIVPGFSIVDRTMDQASMDVLVSNINAYDLPDRFIPKYNCYAYSFFNTLNFNSFKWYLEYAGKTHEAVPNYSGKLIDQPGSVIYSSLTWSKKGIGITGQFKRTDYYEFRTSPNEKLNKGLLNYIPALTRTNSSPLTARYNAATQYIGEMAFEADLVARPSRAISLQGNFSHITNLQGDLLFNEIYTEIEYKYSRELRINAGVQSVKYNQLVYENEGDSMLTTLTPFVEVVYKFNRKQNLRTAFQYMANQKDFGSWLYGLAEFSIAPHWSFAVSDLWNFKPLKTPDPLHYYSVFTAYTHGANRFTLSFVKQVEGIVCTGGVCRFEPAFSGIKLTINSTF